MRTLNLLNLACSLVILLIMASPLAGSQTFTVLATLDGSNGENPYYGPLVQAANGNLYGTTLSGGDFITFCSNGEGFGCGTIFEIAPNGTLSTIYDFCSQSGCTDGVSPTAGLLQAANGDLYGTTNSGGNNFSGTVFELTPAGAVKTLYSFCVEANCADGALPYAGLVQGKNGEFYGTTVAGGAQNQGTVFQLTPAGKLTVLHSFCSQANCADGAFPYGGLAQAANGRLYGTTQLGGVNGAGTIFTISPAGKMLTLHSFNYADGANPTSSLMQGADGYLYGATFYGGTRNNGTIFKMSAFGKLRTIYNFCSITDCPDGSGPGSALIQGVNGLFYGTTASGGTKFGGTVFELSSAGKLKTLYNFCSQTNCADGQSPFSGLIQASDGTLYGTAADGGILTCNAPYGCGTVFSLKP